MIILLNKKLTCDYICKVINDYLSKELKEVKNLNNYALTFNITEIKDTEEIKLIEIKDTEEIKLIKNQ